MAIGTGSPAAGLGNPVFTIWIAPRATIRRIVDTDPTRHVLMLAALGPALNALVTQWSKGAGNNANLSALWPVWVVVNVTVRAMLGVLLLYFNGAILRWAGSLLSGTATSVEVRAALAWSQIPDIAIELFLLAALFMGMSMPQMTPGHLPPLDSTIITVMAVGVPLSIWSFVIYLKCVAEVHRFSAWRALGATFIPVLILVGGIAICFALFWALAGHR
jgi:hypothetical protein